MLNSCDQRRQHQNLMMLCWTLRVWGLWLGQVITSNTTTASLTPFCLVSPLSVGMSFKFWWLLLFNTYYSRKYFMEAFQQVKLITVCKKIAKSGWWRVTRWTHEAEGHESLHASHRQFWHQDKHTNMARTAAPGTPAATTMGAEDTQGEVLGEKNWEDTLKDAPGNTQREKLQKKETFEDI